MSCRIEQTLSIPLLASIVIVAQNRQFGNCMLKLICWFASAVIEDVWSTGHDVAMKAGVVVAAKC